MKKQQLPFEQGGWEVGRKAWADDDGEDDGEGDGDGDGEWTGDRTSREPG